MPNIPYGIITKFSVFILLYLLLYNKSQSEVPFFNDSEASLGNPHAKVILVEYGSDTCPHCAAFDSEVFDKINAKYIKTGKVYYKFREFPTPPMVVSVAGFLTARCAGRDKYFQVIREIYRGQPDLARYQTPRTFFFTNSEFGWCESRAI